MDLHTGQSIWQATDTPGEDAPTALGDLACDVAVVGGGITGALAGHYLTSEGVDVLLVDKGRPCAGSTSASTGLLQYEVDTPLSTLIGKVGQQRAVHAYRRGLWAVEELGALAEQLPEPCGYSRRRSLYFASHWWHHAALKREFDCQREQGFAVELLTRGELAEISSISSAGALMSAGDAQINPLAFTKQLLKAAKQNGMRVFGHSTIQSIEERSDEVLLHTSQARISARTVLIAPGYESRQFLDWAPGNLQSTYAIASEPTASFTGWPEGCLIWETARPYFYARQTDDGRTIVGGADTAFSDDHQRDGLVEKKAELLRKRFAQLFPQIEFSTAFAWAGTFAETDDGLAYIGKPPGRAHTYAALGYGGNGITFSVIAARLLADLYCGRSNPDSEVFSFER